MPKCHQVSRQMNELINMKNFLLFCLFSFAITGTILAANVPASLKNDSASQEEISVTDSRPVKVAFYQYFYQTGEFCCQGFGYVRTENGRLIIYVQSQGDCYVYKSDLREYQYMFHYKGHLGTDCNMYFNL